MMDSLVQEIQSAFQAISLILVFVTVLFGLRYGRINENLAETIPAGQIAQKRLKRKLKESLLINCVPLLVINGGASYLFLPLFLRVIQEMQFKPWDFSFSYCSFISIVLLIFAAFIWSVLLTGKMVKRIAKIQPETRAN
jgi:hypothetical protein